MALELDQKALWSISYGLYIVASRHEGRANAQIANTVIQVAAEPPRIAVAINKGNYTHELIEGGGIICVSVLDIDAPLNLIGAFGFKTGREVDKFESVETIEGDSGCPIVTEHAVSVLEARVSGSVDAGTHTVFIADVTGGKVLGDSKPMTYAAYHDKKGKAPAAAPTYRGAAGEKDSAGRGGAGERKQEGGEARKGEPMKRYVCGVCGYVYDPADGDPDNGVEPGTAFEDLPDDWVCPVCGAEKSEFSPE